jgi:hypothetical protein
VWVAPRAGNPDTWAENDGRSPTIAFVESSSKSRVRGKKHSNGSSYIVTPGKRCPRPPMWDNHLRDHRAKVCIHQRRHGIIMLNELEFSYTPVRDKVRDLREYL